MLACGYNILKYSVSWTTWFCACKWKILPHGWWFKHSEIPRSQRVKRLNVSMCSISKYVHAVEDYSFAIRPFIPLRSHHPTIHQINPLDSYSSGVVKNTLRKNLHWGWPYHSTFTMRPTVCRPLPCRCGLRLVRWVSLPLVLSAVALCQQSKHHV